MPGSHLRTCSPGGDDSPRQRVRVFFVQATATAGGPTDVRLNLNTDARQSPCAAHHQQAGWRDPLPTLMPPAGARQTSQGGGGGSAGYYSQAELRTDLTPAAIGAHYAAGRRAAGWMLHDEGTVGPAIWSM